MSEMKALIARAASGQPLTRAEAEAAFTIMMSGEATPSQIGALLMALRVRGETVDEITGAVSVMRAKMLPVTAPADAIDIVGTGGDSSGSLNISTTTAFVVAGCGVPVAKHGNRALSSQSGAADVLMALGVKIDIGPEVIARCIQEAGVGFMFAPAHHSAMKHVGPTRVELGTRTIFNLLGPLSNPAGVRRQLVGVFARQWVEPLAHALKDLGSEDVMVVHGDGGVDEITLSGVSHAARLSQGAVSSFTITPDDAGLPVYGQDAIKGGTAAENAEALRALLAGAGGAYRDTVLINAAAALMVAGKAADLKDGVALAARSIDSGKAQNALDRLIQTSSG